MGSGGGKEMSGMESEAWEKGTGSRGEGGGGGG